MFLDRDRNNSTRPYMANSRYVIFFKFLVCRNIVSEGMHQSEVIISYILILREIRNVLRGNKCDMTLLGLPVQISTIFPCFNIFMTLNLNLAIYSTNTSDLYQFYGWRENGQLFSYFTFPATNTYFRSDK